jgi:spore maturation protein CgeB
MKVALFCHSVVSCWNHGNVHFLRGVARELIRLGHTVTAFEPDDGWSRTNALADGGADALAEAARLVPGLAIETYRSDALDVDCATDRADLVIAHEWNTPALIAELGHRRACGARYTLLFHDTHHRAVTAEDEMSRYNLDGYDGVLAFGEVLRDLYERRGWGRTAFTWHEAADTALFRPVASDRTERDLIWIGNWGDDERSRELDEYLVRPVAALRLRTRIHGVRYPKHALERLAANGIEYAGWLPNHRAPQAFARARFTVHVPRRPYVEALPGIPTIRVFEALACGIPLISAPWSDNEGLFPAGSYLAVRSGDEMQQAMARLMRDPDLCADLSATGLGAIRNRHTCAHRVRELLAIVAALQARHRTTAARPLTGPGAYAQ